MLYINHYCSILTITNLPCFPEVIFEKVLKVSNVCNSWYSFSFITLSVANRLSVGKKDLNVNQ